MASFRKHGNSWEYRIIFRDIQGKRREVSKRGFKTKALAKAAASRFELELDKNISKNFDMTVYEYAVLWAETYKKPHVTEKTWQTYKKNFRHIKNFFGEKKIREVTYTQYQRILNKFGKSVAQQTLDKFHYQLKGAIKSAVREGIVSSNFADGAIVKSQKAGRPKDVFFLQENEYLNLIEVARSKIKYTSYFTIYLIAVTGMRYAEAVGLTWKDIDFENGFIDVNKTYDYSISQRFAPTKNEASIRKIPIDANTIKILKTYKEKYYKKNDLNRICYGTSNNASNRAIVYTIGRKASNHSLRHTYASYLILKGVDLISISKLLGHENLNITLKIYAHQLESLKEKNDEKIKDIFKKV